MLKSKAKWNYITGTNNESMNEASIISKLLKQRGYNDEVAQQRFLSPNLEHVQKPDVIEQIEVASTRIHQAIEQDEKIVIYGDYDADGITSTALLMKTLQRLGANCHYYIPHRLNEGYGLNDNAIKNIYDNGTQLIITVDNGISSVKEAKLIKQLGMDLIITDHHAVPEQLPESVAIIHPHFSSENNFKYLAGVGVAFQLATQLLGEMPLDLLDLVAIGTVADLVPLREDNRVLVYYGLKQLNKTEHVGLKLLMEKCNIDGMITEEQIGFVIAPRLNSVGRLTNASLAVELLLTDHSERASEIVDEMNRLNRERQTIAQQIYLEAEQKLHHETIDGVIMLYERNWHEGVLGIVASKLVQKFSRPVFIFNYNETLNELKGSARSIPAFNLFENCYSIIKLFTKFGGHSQAAGMTFPFENFMDIKEQLNKLLWEQLTEDDLRQELNIHSTVSIEEMTESLVNDINKLAPFGMGNEKPKFLFEEKPSQIQQIGKEKTHLKFIFQKDNKRVNGIGFQKGYLYDMLSPTSKLSIVGHLQINEWNGHRTVQIICDDIAVNERQIFDHRGKWRDIPFNSYLQQYKTHTIIDSDDKYENLFNDENITFIDYGNENIQLTTTDILYVSYLPNDLDDLAKIVTKTNPSAIYVGYRNDNHTYLTNIPTRQEFKWLYRHLTKVENEEVTQIISKVIQTQKWEKDKVIFMMSVFKDLDFFYLTDRKLQINKEASKKDLKTSKTYQQKLKQIEAEKTLYYSTYDELYEWFKQWIDDTTPTKREVNYR